ncbi:MAG: mechanosensitive ion channel [Chitinophagales bacterium]|nr:mechanosensitive ion channel [Chitinophagales bacterium]
MFLNKLLDISLLKVKNLHITLGSLVMIAVVFIVTYLLLRVFRKFLVAKSRKDGNDGRYITIYQLVKYLTYVIVFIICLNLVGISPGILIASSAALFVGLGLGIQDVFRDLVSGVLILAEGTIKVGDVVEVDKLIAKVKRIGLRTSTVTTNDDIEIIIPNRTFVNNNVINWNHTRDVTRFHIKVGVAYDSDAEKVRSILLHCAMEHPQVLKDPTVMPFVRLADFGDFRLDFELVFWCKRAFQIDNLRSQIRFSILQKFRENNIRIPYPQNDIYIRSSKMEGDLG